MAQQARIACVIADDFEDSEFRIPYDRLRSQGYEVELIGVKAGQEVQGKRGKERVIIEKEIGQTRADDYVALFIPGGYSPDHLRIDRRFADFARTFDARQKLIAAVCHGPQLLITARIVKGRTLTAWPTIQDDLSQLGATVKDEPVVVDRNWITSRKPDDLRAFSDAILERLGHGAQAGQGLGAGQAARP
ncbi:MAG TPA: type 1 glutamine amidotransferase domain-containing protein [Anaeromyxobacteraceae bacterium]|nr:type 1 glutamine amidotransferase domain-containing protein [Anaeromyxobacteraceae bacterium]